jgi:fatty-acyl-CoA synthase
VPTRTLPRTSSGKLARARARLDYLTRNRGAAVPRAAGQAGDDATARDRAPIRNIA